jgi:two-component system sensor histidine kinase RpfC
MLDRFGVRPVFAADGEQALAVLTEGVVDIALLDVNMPIINGIDTAKLYGFSSLGRRQVPLVGLTADATAATRERCLEAGMEQCLLKPIRTAELVGALLAVAPVKTPAPAPPPMPAVGTAVLARATLQNLEDLGGVGFVAGLIDEFGRDGEALLSEIEVACSLPDVRLFRDCAHSLASISANMGAIAVAERCGRWQHMAEAEFTDKRGDLVRELRTLWTATCAAFAEFSGVNAGRSAR